MTPEDARALDRDWMARGAAMLPGLVILTVEPTQNTAAFRRRVYDAVGEGWAPPEVRAARAATEAAPRER